MQEQRLKKLKERIHVPFDETRPDHQVYCLLSPPGSLYSFQSHVITPMHFGIQVQKQFTKSRGYY